MQKAVIVDVTQKGKISNTSIQNLNDLFERGWYVKSSTAVVVGGGEPDRSVAGDILVILEH